MAVRRRPHTILVAPPSPLGGTSERVPEFGGGATVQALVVPISASSAFDKFGVESTGGWEIYVNPGDETPFELKARVVWGERTLSVEAPPKVFDEIGRLDHATVLCTEVRIAS